MYSVYRRKPVGNSYLRKGLDGVDQHQDGKQKQKQTPHCTKQYSSTTYINVQYCALQYNAVRHTGTCRNLIVLTAKYSKLHYSTVRNKQYTLHYSTEHYRQCSTTNRNRNKILPTVHIVHLSRLYYSTVNSTLYSIVQVS